MSTKLGAIHLATICMLTISVGAYSEDLLDKSASAISKNIVMPMTNDLHRRIITQQAKGKGIMAEAARKELAKQEIEAMYAHDAEILIRNQLIAEEKRCKSDCKPRLLMKYLKPNYTINNVVGCAERI